MMNMAMGPAGRAALGLVVVALAGSLARGQEAMYTEAATMPGPGGVILRTQVHSAKFGTDPVGGTRTTEVWEWMNGVQVGLVRDLSLTIEVPAEYKVEESLAGARKIDRGVADLDAMLKYRFYREDGRGVDTVRAAILAGAEIPSGDDDDFSSGSVNPHLGAVVTIIRGRHGFNQDVFFKVNTGGDEAGNLGGEGKADALFLNSAYVFRIFPSAFTSESIGAWYATAEQSTIYETNGDVEVRGSVGLMYEGRRWAFETMVQLPVLDELDERPELDWAWGVGLRFTF